MIATDLFVVKMVLVLVCLSNMASHFGVVGTSLELEALNSAGLTISTPVKEGFPAALADLPGIPYDAYLRQGFALCRGHR